MARSQPAGSYRDAASIAHTDAEAANANAFTHPVDQYADCIRDCHVNRDAVFHSHSHNDCYVDAHDYPYSYADRDSEAADCDSLSNAYATSDHRTGGKAGSIH